MSELIALAWCLGGLCWGLCGFGAAKFLVGVWREIQRTPKL